MVAAVDGEIPVPETPLDRLRLAETAKILYSIGRLETGESTANVATATIDLDAIIDKAERLSAAR